MQKVIFKDLGPMEYQQAWDYQEALLQENVRIKAEARRGAEALVMTETSGNGGASGPAIAVRGESEGTETGTTHYLLMVEHPPVYTLGKSGHIENVLIGEEDMKERNAYSYSGSTGAGISLFMDRGRSWAIPSWTWKNFIRISDGICGAWKR